MNEKNGRVILHGVRHTLLQRQAEAVGLPLRFIPLDWTSSRGERDAALSRGFGEVRADGAACVAFGDLFSLEGRDRRLFVTVDTGLEIVFPLWSRDTRAHSAEMLESGLSAWVCSVDTGCLPANLTGHRFDADFVAGLPEGVDPCGGNDEFHTFVEWAPGWESRVEVEPTRTIEVYDFAFAEVEAVCPVDGSGPPGIDPFGHFARLDRVQRHVDRQGRRDVAHGFLPVLPGARRDDVRGLAGTPPDRTRLPAPAREPRRREPDRRIGRLPQRADVSTGLPRADGLQPFGVQEESA